MRLLLLVSANNGLTQRAALALRRAGHSVRTAVATDQAAMSRAVAPRDFDLIICPFLKSKIPAEIYQQWPTVIIHPGVAGDRGPSSLDWAISDDEPTWGVTALTAVEEMDAGPIWASRVFGMPRKPVRKTAVYNGPVADAAIACVLETVAKASGSSFAPTPQEEADRPVPHARTRPLMTQRDRAFDWGDNAATIVRRVHASDGFPGVRTTVAGRPMFVYDARPDGAVEAEPGTIVGRCHNAVRIACDSGSVWIGHLRDAEAKTCKSAATEVLARAGVDVGTIAIEYGAYRDIRYQKDGQIGTLTFDFYNGAMSTAQCCRLTTALRHAAEQDTRVLVLRGAGPYFSNGIHLGAIELADQPAQEAWENIKAINEVCRRILLCTSQVVIAAFTGNAGAGGVMLPLGADVVAARDEVILNPHYATMGLFGSELHTYTLPRRVGAATARRLTEDCLPIDAATARDIGLVDEVGPRHDFDDWLAELTQEYASEHRWAKVVKEKADRLDTDFARKPLAAYEGRELDEMSRDLFDDRRQFAAKRHAFMYKLPGAPARP